jgi:hypothetical protein
MSAADIQLMAVDPTPADLVYPATAPATPAQYVEHRQKWPERLAPTLGTTCLAKAPHDKHRETLTKPPRYAASFALGPKYDSANASLSHEAVLYYLPYADKLRHRRRAGRKAIEAENQVPAMPVGALEIEDTWMEPADVLRLAKHAGIDFSKDGVSAPKQSGYKQKDWDRLIKETTALLDELKQLQDARINTANVSTHTVMLLTTTPANSVLPHKSVHELKELVTPLPAEVALYTRIEQNLAVLASNAPIRSIVTPEQIHDLMCMDTVVGIPEPVYNGTLKPLSDKADTQKSTQHQQQIQYHQYLQQVQYFSQLQRSHQQHQVQTYQQPMGHGANFMINPMATMTASTMPPSLLSRPTTPVTQPTILMSRLQLVGSNMKPTPVPGQGCINCGAMATTTWRHTAEGDRLCNACGLYYRKTSGRRHRPYELWSKSENASMVDGSETPRAMD